MINIEENVRLAELTTLKIGGNARYFIRARSEDQVAEAFEYAAKNALKLFVLGGGSNVLVSDNGFDGLVLQIGISSKFHAPDSGLGTDVNPALITAGAGDDWDGFVANCVENNLAGVECLSGIPGLVGGTPVQNVGAYGQEVAETIVTLRCFDRNTQEFVALTNKECGFTYRTSIFNSSQRERYIVLSVTFALDRGGDPKLVYKDLIEHFIERKPSLAEVRDAVLKIRRSKSMVIEAGDPNSRSAGSFFKNPIVSRDDLAALRAEFDGVPFFEFGGAVKIPAAWLVENAGFRKGFALRNAGISANHTLAIINRGGASATEILSLKNEIQKAVEARFKISLQPEPVFVGFE
ncbi:MAG: UDP-N-acetylmuramate dehydrogenase [Pyrinomonadaceae bacterium]